MKVWAIVVLVATVVLAKHEQYQGWKSYYVEVSTQEQQVAFGALADQHEVDVLSHPILQRAGVVLVQPQHQEAFAKAAADLGINLKIHVEDIEKALNEDDENILLKNQQTSRQGGKQLPYDNYQELEVIYEYMQDVAERYPDRVTLVNPAQTFEGRPIYYLKISTTNFEDESKPVIFIDGGIHAREWITPPSVTWAIHKLLEDVTEPDLLERFDWILLPVVNPDGYKFTFTTSRFWRKTRSTDQHALSYLCPGVDGNRNYAFAWGTVGVSTNPCSDIFHGGSPFSEIETRVVRDIMNEYLHRMALYLTMHSFGSMILYPWGNDGTLPSNALDLHLVGVAMAQRMDSFSLPNFPNYVVGNSALVLNYAASGAAEDYARSIGVGLAYTYELPGLSSGLNGFHLNPIYIEQVCRETWEGIVIGARLAGDRFQGVVLP